MLTDDAKFLKGDKRIEFLFNRIKELRSIYMSIKAQVAGIERKRKRARRREREGKHGLSCFAMLQLIIATIFSLELKMK